MATATARKVRRVCSGCGVEVNTLAHVERPTCRGCRAVARECGWDAEQREVWRSINRTIASHKSYRERLEQTMEWVRKRQAPAVRQMIEEVEGWIATCEELREQMRPNKGES